LFFILSASQQDSEDTHCTGSAKRKKEEELSPEQHQPVNTVNDLLERISAIEKQIITTSAALGEAVKAESFVAAAVLKKSLSDLEVQRKAAKDSLEAATLAEAAALENQILAAGKGG
jgi:mannitol-specific phosphotransferase system IIBC component